MTQSNVPLIGEGVEVVVLFPMAVIMNAPGKNEFDEFLLVYDVAAFDLGCEGSLNLLDFLLL